jgi:hypothetical protein
MSVSTVVVAAKCPVNSVAHWQASFSCGLHQPSTVPPVMAHAAYSFGYWLIPALIVAGVILVLARRREPARAAR